MHLESHLHQDQWKAFFKVDCQVTAVILNEKVLISSEVIDATVLLFSVGSFSSTARFSITAFHHYSPLFPPPYVVGMNTMLLLSFQEWMQNSKAETKQNQKLQKNVVISVFASSQLTNGMSYSFSLSKLLYLLNEKRLSTVQKENQNQNHYLLHLAGILH